MAEKRKFEYFLLRYVPDAVKGEFVNFGVLALQDGPEGRELAAVRFASDRSRIHCLDPQVDWEVLSKLQDEIQSEIGRRAEQALLWRRIEDSFSSLIQVSLPIRVLTEKVLATEIDDVARRYLEAPKVKRISEPSGRRRILDIMRHEFESTNVLDLLNSVPAEPYTKAGDPFEFDFGYRFGDEIKLFHAVSLRGGVDTAVMLAARFPKIALAMAQLAGVSPVLTAVIESELDRNRTEVGFALEMMRESEIRVATTAEMGGIADLARVELAA